MCCGIVHNKSAVSTGVWKLLFLLLDFHLRRVTLGLLERMEALNFSKIQAVELADCILQARDEELAFMLQLQEIVKSTSTLPNDLEGEESLSQPLRIDVDLDGSQTAADKDNEVAIAVAVDELGTLVVETEETRLSLLEADRLAHLDAILEHDAQFARSIANEPDEDWEEFGDKMADPFVALHGPSELLAHHQIDSQFDSVVRQFGDAASTFRKKRSPAGKGKHRLVIRCAKVPSTEIHLQTVQQEKGKFVLREGDDDDAVADPLLPDGSPTKKSRRTLVFLPDSPEEEDRDAVSPTDDGDEGDPTVCQICFEASVATSPFVSLEGCGHKFCETCASRHAEAKILDGRVHISCPHVGCETTISFTQLSFLLNTEMLGILSRRQIEAAIPDSERLYCPFKDCSALLCKPDCQAQRPSSSAHPHSTTFGCVECDACHRAFCLECAVAWHADMSCAEFKANLKNQSLLGDEKLLRLADEQKWQRCKCGRVVELTHGCYHMSCICGHAFCYRCGAPWLTKAMKQCSCPVWSESNL